MSMNQVASDLYQALTESDERKPKPYDTKAEVLRTEGNIVWVKIPGGVDETPVQKTNNANAGDQVMVRISGGRAWLLGNETSPATDDTVANAATQLAEGAGNLAKTAANSATEAQQNAQIAYIYADQAHAEAQRAAGQAAEAEREAERAWANAQSAYTAATTAQTQLSIIEDVAGTIDWIRAHGAYIQTTDTTVQEGTIYFEYDSASQDYTPIINPDPTKNPQQEGWYVLDISDSQTDYIMSHLAVTSRGLWVLPNGMASGTTPASGETQADSDARQASKYKALLSSEGLFIYDGYGVLVSTFGENIIFSSTRDQRIGSNNNYIEFDATDNSISIIGDSIIFDSLNDTNSALSDLTNRVTENETNITSQSEIISQQSEMLSGVVESTNENTQVLNELVESSDELTTYVKSHMIVTSEGLFLQLDGSSSGVQINGTGVFLYDQQGILAEYSNVVRLGDANDAHITLSPTNGLGFYIGAEDASNPRTNRVAYISSENLVIDKSEIIDTFRIGNFMWKVQSQNRISLMFSPQTGG